MKLLVLIAAVLLVWAQLGDGAPTSLKETLQQMNSRSLDALAKLLKEQRLARGKGPKKSGESQESKELTDEEKGFIWIITEIQGCLAMHVQTEVLFNHAEDLVQYLEDRSNVVNYLRTCKTEQDHIWTTSIEPHVGDVAYGLALCMKDIDNGRYHNDKALTAGDLSGVLQSKKFYKDCYEAHKDADASGQGSGSGAENGAESGSGNNAVMANRRELMEKIKELLHG